MLCLTYYTVGEATLPNLLELLSHPCCYFMLTYESFQLQMGFSFPFLRANDLRTSLLIMRTCSLSYVGLYLNLIANAVNNNDQHVRSGTNVRMSQNPHRRRKRMGTGEIIARRTTITLRPGQRQAARQLHRGLDADADADADAEGCNSGQVKIWAKLKNSARSYKLTREI